MAGVLLSLLFGFVQPPGSLSVRFYDLTLPFRWTTPVV